MDPDREVVETPERRSVLVPVLIAVGVGLVVGVILGASLLRDSGGVEIVTDTVGAVSVDLDSLALEGTGDSYDLTHATLIDCDDSLERGTDVNVGIAEITTGDSDPPPDAFLNTPEARVVLWVECTSS